MLAPELYQYQTVMDEKSFYHLAVLNYLSVLNMQFVIEALYY